MSEQVGLYEAKTKLSALIAKLAETGEPITLTKHGQAVAELRLPPSPAGPKAGMLQSSHFQIADDFDDVDCGFEELYGDEMRLPAVAEPEAKYKL